ncbi:hypothetical protein [Corynebacterium cystitidis]|uniref:hypothetical protein n=1 Tax=Corynebacterium cystitidis TaxID=35757 RepID=UPI00115F800D|nr:hypothetical protein [Corynebacterium cystitidis]
MFTTLVSLGFAKARVHQLTGLATSSLYELTYPGRRRVAHPTPHALRTSVIAYSDQQRDEIAQRIDADPTKSTNQRT